MIGLHGGNRPLHTPQFHPFIPDNGHLVGHDPLLLQKLHETICNIGLLTYITKPLPLHSLPLHPTIQYMPIAISKCLKICSYIVCVACRRLRRIFNRSFLYCLMTIMTTLLFGKLHTLFIQHEVGSQHIYKYQNIYFILL